MLSTEDMHCSWEEEGREEEEEEEGKEGVHLEVPWAGLFNEPAELSQYKPF